MLTEFKVTQSELEFSIFEFNKIYDMSEKFRNFVNRNAECEEQARSEKLQTAVLINLCKLNDWKLTWLNKMYDFKRSHKERVIGIFDIPYYTKFFITNYPIDERSKVSISTNRINWCKEHNINSLVCGVYQINDETFYFGMNDIDQIPIIGEFHAAGTKRNRNSDFFRDTYQIRLLDLNNLSFENKGAII